MPVSAATLTHSATSGRGAAVSFSHDMPAISFTEKVTLQSQRRVDGEQCAARRRPARHEGHMRGDHCRLHGSGATSPHGTIASTD